MNFCESKLARKTHLLRDRIVTQSRWFCFLLSSSMRFTKPVIHKVSTEKDSVFLLWYDNYKLDSWISSEKAHFFLINIYLKRHSGISIFLHHHTRATVIYREMWFSSVSGSHSNTHCVIAAPRGLFSAGGGSLTPVCQGEAAMIEEENDPALTGRQLLGFFSAKKSPCSLHLTVWKTAEGTFHHRYWACLVNLEC